MGKSKPAKMTTQDAQRIQSAVDKGEQTAAAVGFKARAMSAAAKNEDK